MSYKKQDESGNWEYFQCPVCMCLIGMEETYCRNCGVGVNPIRMPRCGITGCEVT